MDSAMLRWHPAFSSRAPLVMPLLTLMLLALLATETGAMWVPDDVASVTTAPERDNVLSNVPPPEETPGSLRNQSTADAEEGSGVTGLGNADDYTDDVKWTEEGEEKMSGNLDPQSSVTHTEENPMTDGSKDRNALPSEVTSTPGVLDGNEDVGADDADIFFEEGAAVEPPHVSNVVPTNDDTLMSGTEANVATVEYKSSTQPEVQFKTSTEPNDNEPTTAFISESTTSSSDAMQSSLARGDGGTLSHLYVVSPTRQTLTTLEAQPIMPSDDDSQSEVRHSAKGSFVPFFADAPETEADADPDEEADADPDEEADADPDEVIGDTAVLSSASPASYVSAATTASPESNHQQQATATATEAVPTQSATTTTKVLLGDASNDEESSLNSGSDSDASFTTHSIHDSSSHPGLRFASVPTLPTQVASDIPATSPSPSPLPICLQECQSKVNSFQLQVTPANILMQQGGNILLHCSLNKPTESDLSVTLEWRFKSENGSEPCSMSPSRADEAIPKCSRADAKAEEEFSNQTEAAIRLTVPNATPSDSGEYVCALTLTCCEGTAHAQSVGRSEAAAVRIYTKPLYGVQLGALSVLCLCLLLGIVGSACFLRRRQRKRCVSGRDHVYYEPVRLLHLPQPTTSSHDDVEGDDDDFDDAGVGEWRPMSANMGSVRVNPMAEVPLTPAEVPPTPPEVMPPQPEVVFSPRESQFEFPRPPSDLMKRLSTNVGFD